MILFQLKVMLNKNVIKEIKGGYKTLHASRLMRAFPVRVCLFLALVEYETNVLDFSLRSQLKKN